MPTIHLTDIALKALKPATAQVDYYCDQQSNFGVRVSPSGTKSFFVRVGDSRRRIHLGKYPGTKLADARKAASRQVNDPQVPIASQRFETALETYFETYIRPNYRERTAKETERLLNKHATPLHKQLREITTSDCTAIFDGLMSTPSEANHLFGVLKTFFAWCEQRQLISLSPIARLSKPAKETSRDRVLTNAELKAVWNATASASQFDTIVRLCILLGQRRGEIATIEPSWITDGVLTIPRHVTKNGVEHPVPLTTRALAILKQTQLGSYNSWSSAEGEARRTIRCYGLDVARSPPNLRDNSCFYRHAAPYHRPTAQSPVREPHAQPHRQDLQSVLVSQGDANGAGEIRASSLQDRLEEIGS